MLLRRLQSKKQHKLNKNQRYRIISNLGAVAFGEGRIEEAAKNFLEAVLLEPDDEKARTNEVFAHFLRRDFQKAFQLAAERKATYPHSTRLATLWIICAPPSISLEELTAPLDSAHLSNHEVCVALARRCMPLEKLPLAEQYATTAISSEPKWLASMDRALLGGSRLHGSRTRGNAFSLIPMNANGFCAKAWRMQIGQ